MTLLLRLIHMGLAGAEGSNSAGFYGMNAGSYPGFGGRPAPRPEAASLARQAETPGRSTLQRPMQFPSANFGQENKQQTAPAPFAGAAGSFQRSSPGENSTGAGPQKKPPVSEGPRSTEPKNDAKWDVKTFLDLIKDNPGVKEGFYELLSNYGIIDSNPAESPAQGFQKKSAARKDFHNTEFKNDVKWNVRTFFDFLKNNPGVKEGFYKLISNYGIIDPDLTENSGLNSPDPDYLIRSLDEALSIHSSFKKFVRKLLLSINGHILANNDKIRMLVRKMKEGLGELAILKRNIYKTKSTLRKSEFLKEYATLLISLDEPKNEFVKAVLWFKKVQEGLEEKL